MGSLAAAGMAGRLQQRQELNQGLTETFGYDALDRVTSSQVGGGPALSYSYDASGNLLSKSDVGSYSYGSASHPHAVTSIAGAGLPSRTFTYDDNGNQATRDGLAQSWTSFDMPSVLRQSVSGSTYESQFSYGPYHQRWRQVSTYTNGTETTYYAGDGLLEKQISTDGASSTTYWRHYVSTPSGAIVVIRNAQGVESKYFIATDHLGSSDVILGGDGNVAVRESFTAWGARRGGNWSSGTAPDWTGIANTTRHGFTGHEHLDNVGLIHMNGRVYDPAIGRVLSVDPVIADLADSQSVNAYAYVGNRPLAFTDPSGLEAACGPLCVVDFIQQAYFLFNGLFSDNPPPPLATVMIGSSAQNGVGMCLPGTFSVSCSGGSAPPRGAPGVTPLGFGGPGPESSRAMLSSPMSHVAIDVVISFIPGVGQAKGIYDAYIIVMDPQASRLDKTLAVVAVLPAGKLIKEGRAIFRIIDEGGETVVKVERAGRKTIGVRTTTHGVQGKINRGVRSADELDALQNPLDVRPVKIDELGRPSQRYVGRKAEVVVNPETGVIVSVNPTSTKKAERLLRRQGGGE